MTNKLFCIILLLLFSSSFSFSQDKKAELLYKSAVENINLHRYNTAISELHNALKLDNTHQKSYFLLGKIYYKKEDLASLEILYKTASRNLGEENPKFYLLAANTLFTSDKYIEAANYYQKYIDNNNSKAKQVAIESKLRCLFIDSAYKNPVPFKPINLGDSINSINSEYLPSLTADEQQLVITVKLPKKVNYSNGTRFQEDFYISHRVNGAWTKVKSLSRTINTKQSEGAQSITADGKEIYFTSCDKHNGYGSCDIYKSKITNGNWTVPANIGRVINSKYWDSQPSISADGKTLYFASNRPGGKGKIDIYYSTKNKKGYWTKPINIGDAINTSGSEQSPFIHLDGKTLYFSSNNRIGLGGYDLYVSKKNDDNTWSEPQNLGYPINTKGNEISLIVNARGDKAYYASKRKNGFGKQDIYYFDLHENVRPINVSYVKGKVVDKFSKKPLSAKFELVDLKTDEIIYNSVTEENTGDFLICLLANNSNYALNISKEGYMLYSENFRLTKADTIKAKKLRIELQPIKVGETTVLNNVFFGTDSYQLKDESRTELDKLVEFLMENPSINIEISGHTDNVGSPEYNKELSKNRALAVKNYIVNSNINSVRLSHIGYGEEKNVVPNNSAINRAKNRRTEFMIVKD